MNIGNGFIVKTIEEAIQSMEKECKGEVRQIPFPITSNNLSYFLSQEGVAFGCAKHKGFYLVTRLAISNRYKKGPIFRISIGPHKMKEIYLPHALYNTFQMKGYDDNIELEYLDGNPYNYNLANMRLKPKKVSEIFMRNINSLKDYYESSFEYVVRQIVIVSLGKLSIDDAKDVASDAFLYMCNNQIISDPVGLWIHIAKFRMIDLFKYAGRYEEIDYKNGAEKIAGDSFHVETDIMKYINGIKQKKYVRLWAAGETPSEIAEITDSTLSTVGSVVTRQIQKLRKIYRRDIEIWRNQGKIN